MSSGHVSNKMMVPAGMDAETMTSTQCLDTVAAILAGALLRLRAKQATGRKEREFFRDSHLEVPPEIGPYAIGPK